jgi:hypothetical protein
VTTPVQSRHPRDRTWPQASQTRPDPARSSQRTQMFRVCDYTTTVTLTQRAGGEGAGGKWLFQQVGGSFLNCLSLCNIRAAHTLPLTTIHCAHPLWENVDDPPSSATAFQPSNTNLKQ